MHTREMIIPKMYNHESQTLRSINCPENLKIPTIIKTPFCNLRRSIHTMHYSIQVPSKNVITKRNNSANAQISMLFPIIVCNRDVN